MAAAWKGIIYMANTTATIIVAVLSFFGTIIGAFLANRKASALIAYRLEQLEKKVDKHNTVIERTYALEKKTEVLEEKVKVANNRIADLESGKG